jgi:hypothetical protein
MDGAPYSIRINLDTLEEQGFLEILNWNLQAEVQE